MLFRVFGRLEQLTQGGSYAGMVVIRSSIIPILHHLTGSILHNTQYNYKWNIAAFLRRCISPQRPLFAPGKYRRLFECAEPPSLL